jgi:DnaJ-domain-containing protein 1
VAASEDNNVVTSCCCGCIVFYLFAAAGIGIAETFRSPVLGVAAFIVAVVVLMAVGSGHRDGQHRHHSPGGSSDYDGKKESGEDPFQDLDFARLVFIPIGYVAGRSSCSLSMQYLFVDEIIERCEFSYDVGMAARDFVNAGRVASKNEIYRIISSSFHRLKYEDRIKIFLYHVSILFYDSLLTRNEINLFYEIGAWYQFPKAEIDRLLREMLKRYALEYDRARDCYRIFDHEEYDSYKSRSENNYSSYGSGYSDNSRGENYTHGGEKNSHYSDNYGYTDSKLRNAYLVLGVDSTTSNEDVKKAYRRLMSKYHPDKAIAQGLGKSGVKRYTELCQSIQLAWETVKEYRNLN